MRLTLPCFYRHPKYYYFCNNKFKWGLRKHKEACHKVWRRSILLKKNLKVEDYMSDREFKLPSGYILEDASDILNEDKLQVNFIYNKDLPWPYNKSEPDTGTKSSENYKEENALVYNKKTNLLEGFKGVLNFSNTVLESENSLPQLIKEKEDKVVLNNKVLELLDKRLDWSLENDSFNYKLSKTKVFPKINKIPLKNFGPCENRKEYNSLNSYYECSDFLVSKNEGLFHRPKIIYPNYSITFNRENKKLIFDLRCDFLTLHPESLFDNILNLNTFLNNDTISTIKKDLINIEPVNWKFNFEKKHFYPDNLNFTNNAHNVHTIFLSTSVGRSKPKPDRYIKGHSLMFLYGYSVAKARKLYGNIENYEEKSNYKILEKPIVTHSVFINYLKRNIGFASFQLNTTDFKSDIKNQVWFDGMYDLTSDKELILKKLTAINLFDCPKVI